MEYHHECSTNNSHHKVRVNPLSKTESMAYAGPHNCTQSDFAKFKNVQQTLHSAMFKMLSNAIKIAAVTVVLILPKQS